MRLLRGISRSFFGFEFEGVEAVAVFWETVPKKTDVSRRWEIDLVLYGNGGCGTLWQ
jgi:hypothetical protein